MSRTKEGRDALRSSEAHPQARSIAPPWPERSQGRVLVSSHSPKSAEIGEARPLPRSRSSSREADRPSFASLIDAAHPYRACPKTGFFNEIDVLLPFPNAALDASIGRNPAVPLTLAERQLGRQ